MIQKLLALLLIRQDYANHMVYGSITFTGGFLLGLPLYLFASQILLVPFLTGSIVCCGLAWWKEYVNDASGKGNVDANDFWSSLLGGLATAVPAAALALVL